MRLAITSWAAAAAPPMNAKRCLNSGANLARAESAAEQMVRMCGYKVLSGKKKQKKSMNYRS